MVVSRNF